MLKARGLGLKFKGLDCKSHPACYLWVCLKQLLHGLSHSLGGVFGIGTFRFPEP